MKRMTELICDQVLKRIKDLSFECKGCPRVSQCESQSQGEPRYCLPLITAALLEQSVFTTEHRTYIGPCPVLNTEPIGSLQDAYAPRRFDLTEDTPF